MKFKKLEEDVAYGIYDRPIGFDEQQEQVLTDPIVASPQMSTQLSSDKPPVEDESYAPTSKTALASSAAEIARAVPDDQILFFYKGLHRLLDNATDKTEQQSEEDMQESKLRNSIKKMILEVLSDEEVAELDKYRAGTDRRDDLEEPPSAPSDESNLDDLADEFGFSGASGVRQFINRVLSKLSFAAKNIDSQAIDALTDFAVPEYISTMEENQYIDAEDVADLKSAPQIVKGLPSFKYFFVSGFILPVYKQMNREKNRSLRDSIDALGLPASLHDTVFNQATGRAAESTRTISSKLDASVNSGEISREDSAQLMKSATEFVKNSLKTVGDDPQEFVDKSLAKWQGLSRTKRANILERSLQDTLDDGV